MVGLLVSGDLRQYEILYETRFVHFANLERTQRIAEEFDPADVVKHPNGYVHNKAISWHAKQLGQGDNTRLKPQGHNTRLQESQRDHTRGKETKPSIRKERSRSRKETKPSTRILERSRSRRETKPSIRILERSHSRDRSQQMDRPRWRSGRQLRAERRRSGKVAMLVLRSVSPQRSPQRIVALRSRSSSRKETGSLKESRKETRSPKESRKETRSPKKSRKETRSPTRKESKGDRTEAQPSQQSTKKEMKFTKPKSTLRPKPRTQKSPTPESTEAAPSTSSH